MLLALYEARFCSILLPQATRGLRPVRPGVHDSQGRWPCAGLRPAKLSPDTNNCFQGVYGSFAIFSGHTDAS